MSRKKSRNANRTRALLGVERLESRELLSVSQLWFNGDTLCVKTDDAPTSVELRQQGSQVTVTDLSTSQTWSYDASRVGQFEFQGGAGEDRFVNHISNMKIRAWGFGGNDYLEGGDAADYLDGGTGNDTLVGNGGNDVLHGGSGNDVLLGGRGNDQLVGGDGNDRLNGQAGHDKLWGGTGNDVLLGGNNDDDLVGGDGNDHLNGQAGHDKLWGGIGNDVLLGGSGDDDLVGGDGNDHLNGQAGKDRMWGGDGDDVLIAIDNAFDDYLQGDAGHDVFWVDRVPFSSDEIRGIEDGDKVQNVFRFANGADRTLNGDRIDDPEAKPGHTYRAFWGNPLFSSDGPNAADVRQGQLGDCYFVAGLGAIAQDSPDALRQNVVDFDDGTYGIRLGNSFYRVDNDLPVASATSASPVYAGLGQQGSLWVALVEKAFAHYRTGADTYASIESGSGDEANRAFGSTSAGRNSIKSYANATVMANDIYQRWNTDQSVTVGFSGSKKAVASGDPFVLGHAYTVMSVKRNAAGIVTGIVLRNPWGTDGGGSNDSNPYDGLITVTPAQIFKYAGHVAWGRVN